MLPLKTKLTCLHLASRLFESEKEAQLFQQEFLVEKSSFIGTLFYDEPNEKYKLIAAVDKLIDGTGLSANPYNFSPLYQGYPLLIDKWGPVSRNDNIVLSPRRIEHGRNESIIKLLTVSISLLGFNTELPVILDKKGRVLDGLNKLIACQRLEKDCRYQIYDYDPDVDL